MRLTHIITRLIVGGAQENTLATVLGLRTRDDVEVSLLAGPTTGPEGSLEAQAAAAPGLLTIVPSLVRPVHPWRDARALLELTRQLRQWRPDLVHTHSGKAGVLGRWAAHRAGVRAIVHTIHGPSFGPWQSRLGNLIFRTAEARAARWTSHFVSVADAMTRQYLAAGIGRPEQYTRVLSGFDTQPYLAAKSDLALRQRLGLGPEHVVIGKLARLFRLKGHDDLLAVAPELVRRHPHARFLWVGDGPCRARFVKRVRRLGLANFVVLAGLVPPQEIPRYVGIMDLVVHLSRREGLPRALPQALAAARPVVAWDCDGAGEVCLDNETGFLLRPGDWAGLRERLSRLVEQPELRARLGRRGQALVRESFSVDRMVATLYALYRDLLERTPPQPGP
ncbi:MAG: glycosyltransferase family 4 protein [Verrucomicrobia bacterium]|nr:glycosyltransferase family 4 protein [Verrucomicrobiota bacterium]